MRTIRTIIIFCWSVFFAGGGAAFAAEKAEGKNLAVQADASVNKDSIWVGDKITYVITIKAPKDSEVEFPKLLAENLGGFTVKDFGSSQGGLFGRKIFRQWHILYTYESGEHTISAPAVKYRPSSSSEWQKLDIKEIKVQVKSVLAAAMDQRDIRDIRGPKNLAGKIRLYALTVLAALLIAASVFGLVFLKRSKEAREPPPVPAHVIAYEALAALEKKDYIRKGQAKAYYIELSDIARRYLENRFNIRAPEMTTEEFLVKVKEDSALSREHKGLLRDFLSNCDLVKFARYQPAEQEAALSFASAKRLIDQTKEQAVS